MEREPEQLEFEFMLDAKFSTEELEHLVAVASALEDNGEEYDQMASSSGC
jgi:hypothetical protein